MDHSKLWEILKEMGIPDHLTCLLRNLYTGQEATVRTKHETTDWFQIGKGVQEHLQHSAFFIVQLTHPYMTTGKTLTRWTFVGKVLSLLYNMLSRLVITLLPKSAANCC